MTRRMLSLFFSTLNNDHRALELSKAHYLLIGLSRNGTLGRRFHCIESVDTEATAVLYRSLEICSAREGSAAHYDATVSATS